MKMPSPNVRDHIYKVVAAGMPLLALYGVVGEGEIQPWLLLTAAVLGTGAGALASANTDKPGPHDKP